MRKKIVAGNWKMNNTLDEAVYLVDEILNKTQIAGYDLSPLLDRLNSLK